MTRSLRTPATSMRIKFLIAITGGVIATALRWYFVTHAQVLQPLDDPRTRADAAEYYRYAWNMLHYAVFSADVPGTSPPHPSSFRDPGYPIVLALWMSVTSTYDAWYACVLATHALLGGITVSCLSLALLRELRPSYLATATLLMAVWPHSVSITAYVLSENLTAPLCAAAVLTLSRAVSRPAARRFAVAGALLAAAGLTNAVLAPLVVPLAACLAWKCDVNLRNLALLVCVALAPQLAWVLRNVSLSDDAGASYRAQMNFVQGSWPTYHAAAQLAAKGDPIGTQTMDAINAEIAMLRARPEQGAKDILNRVAVAPWPYLAWYLTKPAILWGWDIRFGQGDIYVYPTRQSPFVTNPALRATEGFAFIINPVLAVFALGSLLQLMQRRLRAVTAIMVTILIWITAVYGALQSEPRYSIPFRGIEICVAVITLATLVRRLDARRVACANGEDGA